MSCRSAEKEILFMMIRSFLLIAFLAIVDLTLALPADDIEKRQNYGRGQCNVNEKTINHGQVFSIPGRSQCIKYRCENGGWDVHEEGCSNNGRCYPVGTSFVEDCRTYRCTKSSRSGYNFYQANIIDTRCKDYYGVCHDSGSQFTYQMRGRVRDRCTCNAQSNGYVSYTCTWV